MNNVGSAVIDLHAREPVRAAVSSTVEVVGLSLLAGIILINDSNFSSAGTEDSSANWQTLLKVAICLCSGLFGILRLMHTRHMLFQPGIRWITLLSCWALLCLPFAINQNYSLMSLGLLWCMILFATALVDAVDPKRILLVIFLTLEVYLLGSWMVHLAAPELNGFDPDTSHAADVARLGGLAHPNSTASKAALAIAATLALGCAKGISWRKLALPLLFAAATLFLTGSRTWLMASLGLVAFTVWQKLQIQARLVLVCGGIAVSALGAMILINDINGRSVDRMLAGISRSQSSEEIYSLTGRAELWELCWGKVQQSPVFGYGYGCQRFVIEDHYWQTRHAHNLLLNTVLGCGFFGGLLLLLMFGSQLIRFRFTRELFPALLLILLIVGGISENPILNPMPGALMLIWLISLVGKFSFNSGRQFDLAPSPA